MQAYLLKPLTCSPENYQSDDTVLSGDDDDDDDNDNTDADTDNEQQQ